MLLGQITRAARSLQPAKQGSQCALAVSMPRNAADQLAPCCTRGLTLLGSRQQALQLPIGIGVYLGSSQSAAQEPSA